MLLPHQGFSYAHIVCTTDYVLADLKDGRERKTSGVTGSYNIHPGNCCVQNLCC